MFGAAQRTRGDPHVCGEAHHSTSEGSNGTHRATAVQAAGAWPDLQERASETRGADASGSREAMAWMDSRRPSTISPRR